jgi:hypothetical protein
VGRHRSVFRNAKLGRNCQTARDVNPRTGIRPHPMSGVSRSSGR